MPVKFTHLDTGDSDTTESYFSDRLLRARIQSGQESNKEYDQILEEGRSEDWIDNHQKEIRENDRKYDEDVNQYITLTLAELANPRFLTFINRYLVGLNADVGQKAVAVEHNSEKYNLYKLNADFLLLNLGLFHPDTNVLGDAYFDKGESYYFCAASSLKAIKRGRSSLSDVLEKLSFGFGKYVEILRYMKNSDDNYFSFHFKIAQAEMEQLEQSLTAEVQKRKDSG